MQYGKTSLTDYTPNLYVSHCLRDHDGNFFLLMWHARDHHVYGFNSASGIMKVGGLEDQTFGTFEEACVYLDLVIREDGKALH